MEELSRLETICLCITSRISTVPPDCEGIDIPTLSMESSRDMFYRIYKNGERSDLIDEILDQLAFHPLSITLLATVAYHNKWETDRLVNEWQRRRTGLLRTQHDKSLAATIELSLACPMFQELGPDAREVLGVAVFFPQGIDEKNIDWLFPTISDGTTIFDELCILSLAYRSNGFITMLAPLRDYLRPKDPNSSTLLCTTKERYFARLSAGLDPNKPDFGDARWITSEDVNVEHLLDVFTTIDGNSGDVWSACGYFMEHLYWHKRWLIELRPKIEGLPDDHPAKSRCLVQLSLFLGSVGNVGEEKRLLTQALKLQREQDDALLVARTIRFLAEANGQLGLFTEGIGQAEEALEIFGRLGDIPEQTATLLRLSWLFYDNKQFEAAETAASRSLDLLPETGEKFRVCQCRCVLGNIDRSRGEVEKAIEHFEAALAIASSFDWHDQLFWNHYSLAGLFFDRSRYDGAHAHVERAKLHVINDPYLLGRATELQAGFWYKERRIEAAKSEALRAVNIYEKLGATKYLRRSKLLLRWIEGEMSQGPAATADKPDPDGKSFETVPVLQSLTLDSQLGERSDGPEDHPISPASSFILPRAPNPHFCRRTYCLYCSHVSLLSSQGRCLPCCLISCYPRTVPYSLRYSPFNAYRFSLYLACFALMRRLVNCLSHSTPFLSPRET